MNSEPADVEVVPKPPESLEDAQAKYGFKISFIDNNSVHVQNAVGREVLFEYPMASVTIPQHDNFIRQMQDKNAPLPDIQELKITISKPTADQQDEVMPTSNSNAVASVKTWEQLVMKYNLRSVDEMQWMWRFARRSLYERFKSRLRDNA